MPEQNPTGGTLCVLKGRSFQGLKDSKFEGKEFDGFFVLARVDRRWYKDDSKHEHLTLTLTSDSELILKLPAWDYDLLYQRDEVAYQGEKDLTDALDNAHASMTKVVGDIDPRQYMYLKLQFKAPVKLSGDVLYRAFEEDCRFPLAGKVKFRSGRHFFFWKVARVDTESFKKGKHEKRTAKSVGATLFDDESPSKMESDGEY